MTESSQGKSESSPFGPPTLGSGPSPFDDNKTTELPKLSKRSVVQTEDDLGTIPIDQLPRYDRHAAEIPQAQQVPPVPATTSTSSFTFPPTTAAAAEPVSTERDKGSGRGTIDMGLLILRVAIGATFIYKGLQKLAGWWGGAGVEGTKVFLDHHGWQHPSVTGVLLTVGELCGGVLVLVGLITPVAAAALLVVSLNSWMFLQDKQPGIQYDNASGLSLITVLGAAAAAIILTGPGRISLDIGRGWATRPRLGSTLALLAGIAGGLAAWAILHGGNPLRLH